MLLLVVSFHHGWKVCSLISPCAYMWRVCLYVEGVPIYGGCAYMWRVCLYMEGVPIYMEAVPICGGCAYMWRVCLYPNISLCTYMREYGIRFFEIFSLG